EREGTLGLWKATIELIVRLFDSEVRVHLLASNLRHEVALLLAGTAVAVRVLEQEIDGLDTKVGRSADLAMVKRASNQLVTDSRLGLFFVRNFLSATVGGQYNRVVGVRQRRFSLEDVLTEMTGLYERLGA